MSRDEPAIDECGLEDESFVGIIREDEIVAKGGGMLVDEGAEVGGGLDEREEGGFGEMTENGEEELGGCGLNGCHCVFRLQIRMVVFLLKVRGVTVRRDGRGNGGLSTLRFD